MKYTLALLSALLINIVTFAQNNVEFTFDISFESNIAKEVKKGNKIALVYPFGNINEIKLVKSKNSCEFEGIEYKFRKEDTILIRFFNELKVIFTQPDFYREFNKTCPELWNEEYFSDGTTTRFHFNSDSIKRGFGARDGVCNFNSTYDQILNSFFNIVFYMVNQKSFRKKLSSDIIDYITTFESITQPPFRHVKYKPMTYRLKGRVYDSDDLGITNLINSISENEDLYIEVGTGFNIIHHDYFYLHFQDFIHSYHKVTWVPDDKIVATRLIELGIDKNHIKKRYK